MSLSSALRKALAPSLLALMTAFAPAANAADAAPATGKSLKLGDCAEASAVKEALISAGYKTYFVYDVELLDEKSRDPVWVRESMWAKEDLKSGFYLSRGGKKDQDLCLNAAMSDIIIANPEDQAKTEKIDERFFSQGISANIVGGLNNSIRFVQNAAGKYPAFQAKMQRSDGGLAYATIVYNPTSYGGGMIFSSLNGAIIDIRTQLVAGPEAKKTGLTAAAKEVLAKQRPQLSNGEASFSGPVASLQPR